MALFVWAASVWLRHNLINVTFVADAKSHVVALIRFGPQGKQTPGLAM